MLHCDNALETRFQYKTSRHWGPNGLENPSLVGQHRRSDLAFSHRLHIRVQELSSSGTGRSNNMASRNWNLFLRVTFLPRVIQRSAFHHTDWDKTHLADHARVAWHIIVFAGGSNRGQLCCECLCNNAHLADKTDLAFLLLIARCHPQFAEGDRDLVRENLSCDPGSDKRWKVRRCLRKYCLRHPAQSIWNYAGSC